MKNTLVLEKENALDDFVIMIQNAWTYQRMTEPEKERCIDSLRFARLIGKYNARWDCLQGIYHAYLMGLGYTGMNWREQDPESIPF